MKLRRRLIFHFTFQFIAMAVLMGVVIFNFVNCTDDLYERCFRIQLLSGKT